MSDQHEHEHDEGDEAEPVEVPPEPTDEEAAEHEEAEPSSDVEEQEASGAVNQKVIDRFFAQLEGEDVRHAKRIGAIMEDEAASLNLCPTCGPIEGMPRLAGFVLSGALHGEAVARMRTALGLNDETNVKPDPYSHRCATCDGWGVVQTGSHVPNLEVRSCDDCNGQGFVLLNAPQSGPMIVAPNGEHGLETITPPAALGPEPPEAASLRARGWAVIPPMQSAAS
jgi:hypothetical protein